MDLRKFKVKSEAEFAYTNKITKKTLRFKPKGDEVVVTFTPQTSDEQAAGVIRGTGYGVSRNITLDRGFGVFLIPAGRTLESSAESLSANPHIANTLPVMVDGEGNTRFFLPDEFTVQFKENVTSKVVEEIVKKKKSRIVSAQRTAGYYTLAVPEGKGLFETIQDFSGLEEVQFAEPSEAGFDDALDYLPDDTDFGRLWGLNNNGQVVEGVSGTIDADIDAPRAWEYTRGRPDVIIAVIDTGADLDHPDLQGNILPRGTEDWDFADSTDPVPDDTYGHGTHVCGITAAMDNAAGIIGVAPKCRIMPLRVDLTAGMNQNRADAINYVTAQANANPTRRFVINCSWRMNGDHTGVHQAIINAVNANVVVVFAAGNTNLQGVTYPARYPETIAVANTNNRDVIDGSSAVGAEVDVCAPGTDIYSTIPNDTYGYLTGTSMASPHVAGLAALIWSRNRGLTNQQVRQIIEATCDNINAQNPTLVGQIGRGRINAAQALANTAAPRLDFRILRKFPFPQKNEGSSSGLSLARLRIGLREVWVLLFLTQKPYSEKIFYLNPLTGAVLRSIDPQNNDTIGSLEWDGKAIRVANVTTGSGFINAIHPVTGAQVGSIPAPAGRGEGLAYDGKYLYYSTENTIHILQADTGRQLRAFPAPGGSCRALAYGRDLLFCGQSAAGIVHVIDSRTRIVHGFIQVPGSGSARVEGLAYNPRTNELFVANQSQNTIYVGTIEW